MKHNIKILFFGDVIGSAGRAGVKHQLPLWREEFGVDFVIVNVENAAHGFGMGREQMKDLEDLEIDIMTGGNHILKGRDAFEILADEQIPIIRPLNAPKTWPGRGYITKKIKNTENETSVTAINLLGQHGMNEHYDSPYNAVETVLENDDVKRGIIIVDWHAETTSEKVLMGWFLDGRVSAVLGTHTHVPTCDERILPNGTAIISDVGMVGPHNSIIGFKTEATVKKHTQQLPIRLETEEEGPIEVSAVLLEIDPATKKSVSIRRLREII